MFPFQDVFFFSFSIILNKNSTLCYVVTLRYVMLCCYVMLCYVMLLCYVTVGGCDSIYDFHIFIFLCDGSLKTRS